MAGAYLLGDNGSGTPIDALRTVTINPANGSVSPALTQNANGEQVVALKDGIPITATAAAGSAVTVTIPATAGKSNYLAYLQIIAYASVTVAGAVAPTLVPVTGLPAALTFTFPTALAVGTTAEQKIEGISAVRASAVNTAIVISAPATTSIIWRINAIYFVV
jgi:hypothetical protein